MLKKLAYKKIIIIFLSFIILLILYLFPNKDETVEFKTSITYTNPKTMPIYLLDNNNYVSRFEIVQKSEDIENKEKMLEAIIYSLTEIKEIKKIMIFIEGEQLNKLPHSQKVLPNILDRSYGINKIYDLTSMKDISKVTTYYISKLENYSYYIPITSYTNTKKEKVEIIIEKLKTSPTYNTNLVSYLSTSAELLKYEILENSVNLSFNNEILSLNDNSIIEEVKYSIALSIRDTYDINKTIFYVDDILMDANFI